MSKYLELTRPNGEKVVIPEVVKAEVAKDFQFSSSRGKYTFNEQTQKIEDYKEPEKKEVNAPAVFIDSVPEGILSNADCKTYYSKKAYRASLRRLGFIEVGNNTEGLRITPDPKEKERYEAQLRDDLEKAYYDVRENRAELSEYDKHRCEIVNRQIRDTYDNRERDEFGNP